MSDKGRNQLIFLTLDTIVFREKTGDKGNHSYFIQVRLLWFAIVGDRLW